MDTWFKYGPIIVGVASSNALQHVVRLGAQTQTSKCGGRLQLGDAYVEIVGTDGAECNPKQVEALPTIQDSGGRCRGDRVRDEMVTVCGHQVGADDVSQD